jgi:hypothetical protein
MHRPSDAPVLETSILRGFISYGVFGHNIMRFMLIPPSSFVWLVHLV